MFLGCYEKNVKTITISFQLRIKIGQAPSNSKHNFQKVNHRTFATQRGTIHFNKYILYLLVNVGALF